MIEQTVMTEEAAPEKHSGLGIASFVLSLVSGAGLLALFAIAGIIGTQTPGGLDEESPQAILIGISLFAFMGLLIVGLGIGIAGFFQKNRKSVFAILGMVISMVTVLGTGCLLILGLMFS